MLIVNATETIMAKKDLTQGNVTKTMLLFAAPMILGNLLQQCYNIADTLIVGQFIGADALAAVGSAYTLMTFLTSILIGLCMGSSSVFSYYFGQRDDEKMKNSILLSFLLISAAALIMTVFVFAGLDLILKLLQTPDSLFDMMHGYVFVIFIGIFFVFLYNYFAFLLRALGNSVTPLWFLGLATLLNIVLDLIFVIVFHWGVEGAAAATVIAQAFSGIGICLYTWYKEPALRPDIKKADFGRSAVKEIVSFSFAASIQQSVMNFGILMIQGLVNSFGPAVMAAFAAAVKIDSFAYMPAQEFGNAFSLFISQNYGGSRKDRIREGTKNAFWVSTFFCLAVSVLVFVTAPYLMMIFIQPSETDHLDRNGLSADRRRILLRYRALVSALRLLPRYPPSGNVARPHGHFTRHARITGIPARSASIHRRIRYLVVDSDRLVPCRCRRTSLYAFFEEYDFQKRTPIK